MITFIITGIYHSKLCLSEVLGMACLETAFISFLLSPIIMHHKVKSIKDYFDFLLTFFISIFSE